jgi:hypothetical protein
MTESLVQQKTLSSWREVLEAFDYFAGQSWVFRGHERADWPLETSLEREFGHQGAFVEEQVLWQFVRTAPRLLPSHLIPHDNDAAAWLGLIQHYGGPTRLLDVTRSPYVALFFAFEPNGDADRALWVIDDAWCAASCAEIMANNEKGTFDNILRRVLGAQAQLVYSIVHRQPHPDVLFEGFKPFSGVFPLDPWKPDTRQSAQQAMFLCAANPGLGFIDNLSVHQAPSSNALFRFVLPGSMRQEVLGQLSIMNVTAATLFPDLGGLARSLRTYPVRLPRNESALPPWETPS